MFYRQLRGWSGGWRENYKGRLGLGGVRITIVATTNITITMRTTITTTTTIDSTTATTMVVMIRGWFR